MVWEQGSTLIIMLTDVIEAGKVRCCKYWPKVNGSQEYGKYEITTLSEQGDRVYFTRQLLLKNRMVWNNDWGFWAKWRGDLEESTGSVMLGERLSGCYREVTLQ